MSCKSFEQLGLAENLLAMLDKLNYTAATEIQQQAIPQALAGKDLIAMAATGSGKTAAFTLPLIQQLDNGHKCRGKRIRALILCPTRELAQQLTKNIANYIDVSPLTTFAAYGGVPYEAQKQALIKGVDIFIATPGRLRDLLTQRALYLDEVNYLVLDEADKMLDMGFYDDIERIIEQLPKHRQNLLFSATMAPTLQRLAKNTFNDPVIIKALPKNRTAETVKQWLTPVDKEKKSTLISQLLLSGEYPRALIFIQTKAGAAKLVSQLEKRGIIAESFHSGRSQAIRTQVLQQFAKGQVNYLVATGVAARGIDIEGLDCVINYDLPFEPDDYIHRVGRTGRAGKLGEAITFVSKDDFKNLCAIEKRLNMIIERNQVEGFEPRKPLPKSDLNFVAKQRPAAADKQNLKKPVKIKPTSAQRAQQTAKLGNRGDNDPWAKHRK
ncbi:DEAD/DEAH box helicase [Paraferrimonas sp. SM1919]|uniref:DEAD/DEAH box helicase n=1 Tax=Paraferrimonas sp. SM1919 TaxID=2662263 RepID=UPI0013D6BEAC|nr:DEAD/DEAH box helicase [Paraferrimonas sp. SM1919]